MAVSKAKKSEQLAALEVLLKDATSVGFTSNQKITALEVSALKRDLRAQNAVFVIVKKTLIRIAFKNVYSVDLDLDTLPGQVALVIGKGDAIAPLGVANKYANDWRKEEKMVFVGGYMEGRMMDGAETKKLATLPSREVLLAKLLGSMMSPLSGLARFFDAAGKDLTTKGLAKVGDLTSALPAKKEEAPKAEAAPEAPVAAPAVEEAPAPVAETPVEATPEVAATEEVKTEETQAV
jgi:large subunit ribosomal protein L10